MILPVSRALFMHFDTPAIEMAVLPRFWTTFLDLD